MKDENLIFIISQPRSGSSLLQQLLLSDTSITSSPEPWQMLSLIHTYKQTELSGSYNPRFSAINFTAYLDRSDKGLEGFKEKIKDLSLSLYDKMVSNENYFLDKTPRYYHVIDELYELFPKAKFIFLVRNPLAVFGSILSYNFSGDYKEFLKSEDRIDDLLLAPEKIVLATRKYPNHILIKYEDIVGDTSNTIRLINDYLGVDIPLNVTYHLKGQFKGTHAIDTKSVNLHKTPVSKYLNSWKESIDSGQKKKLAIGYIDKLLDMRIYDMNYRLEDILESISNHVPQKRTYFNHSFDMLSTKEEKLSILALNKKRLYNWLSKLFNT